MRAASRRANKLRRLLALYCDVGIIIYFFLLAKNLLIIALNQQLAANYRWLDCFLFGRVQIASRIPEASKICTIFIDCYMIINRLIYKHLMDDMQLFIFEFVSPELAQLKQDELEEEEEEVDRECGPTRKHHFMLSRHIVSSNASKRLRERPNRGVKSPWRMRTMMLAYFSGMFLVWVGYMLTNTLVIGPMFVTKRGFELLYPNCVTWILRVQNNSSPANYFFDYIYQIDSKRAMVDIYEGEIPLVLPLDNLVEGNLYHGVRITGDIFEFYLTQMDIYLSYGMHIYFVLRISIDLMIYIAYLRKRLKMMAFILKQSRYVQAPANFWRPQKKSLYERELVAIQAELHDYFRFVNAYNPYISLNTIINTIVWLFYTSLMFARHIKSNSLHVNLDRGIQAEFVLMFVISLMVVLFIMICEFIFGSQARQMFGQIAQVAALDDGNSSTKLRWITLMKFYQPRSLFCCTIMNSIELSWLYGLKFFSWVISAIIIIRSL